MKKWLLFLFSLNIGVTVFGQFSAINLMEYQHGRLPSDTVNSFSNLYNRLLVDYTLDKFKVGFTFEQFTSPYQNRNYYRITQARLDYYGENLEIKVGNFYETYGRGTLLRSYQIPGAVLQDLTFRSRYYFNQDMLGAQVKYKWKKLTMKALYGAPLNAVLPPTQEFEDRRPDKVGMFDLGYEFEDHAIGWTFQYLDNVSKQSPITMLRVSGRLG